jgi:hypothetical protein
MEKENLLKEYVAPKCEVLQFELEQNILNPSPSPYGTDPLPDMGGENWGFN